MSNKFGQTESILIRKTESGFSIPELVVVLLVLTILAVLTMMSMSAPKLQSAETQAIQLADIFQEARQRALSQRTTMRVEINSTKNVIRLIDEKTPGNAGDDTILRFVNFNTADGVFIATAPTNISGAPTELSPAPAITMAPSNHPLSNGDNVGTLRFLRNGTVTNAGTNAAGNGAVVTGAAVYVWSKYQNSANTSVGQVIRAVTVLGTTGLTRMWKCPVTNGTCTAWVK